MGTRPPSQGGQEGVDIVTLMGAPEEEAARAPGWSPLHVSDDAWDAEEVDVLSGFADDLLVALKVPLYCPEVEDTPFMDAGIGLHFYFHGQSDLQRLLSRCSRLARQLEVALRHPDTGGGEEADAREGDVPEDPRPAAAEPVAGVSTYGGGGGGSRRSLDRVQEVVKNTETQWQLHMLRLLIRLLTSRPCIDEDNQRPFSGGEFGGQAMVSVVEEEVARYATPWVGCGLQAATAVDWAGEGVDYLYDWSAENAAGGITSSCSDRVYRLLLGSHTRSLWPVGQKAAHLVQLRPDHPSSNLPPSLFWELWRWGDAAFGGWALLHRAHATRWVEERLVRLGLQGSHGAGTGTPVHPAVRGSGSYSADLPHLIKRKLNLLGILFECGWPLELGGPSFPDSTLRQAAQEVSVVGRAAEVSQFWEELLRTPPAVRAREGRGSLVLGDVRMEAVPTAMLDHISGRRGKRYTASDKAVLVGRALWPQGCETWRQLEDHTGLKRGDSVVVTLAGPNPEQYQGPGRVSSQRCALGTVLPYREGTGLWVLLDEDPMLGRYPELGMPVLGTHGLTLQGLAKEAREGGAVVALDATPNVSSWVTAAVLDQLYSYDVGDASMDRLTLPPELAAAVGAEETEDGVVDIPPSPAQGLVPGGYQGGSLAQVAVSGPDSSASRPVGLLPAPRPLDGDQEAAVRAFVDSPPGGIMLLQGPPGTGKTETAARAVLQFLASAVTPAEGGLVLVSGPTHAAIDVALMRMGELLQGAGGLEGGVPWERVRLVRVGEDRSKEPDAEPARRRMRGLGIQQHNPKEILTG